jgi:hypothetical protein
MLSQEDYLMIKTLKKRGVYNKDIAAVSRSLQESPERSE